MGAAPDALYIANAEAVRKAIAEPSQDQAKTKPFEPQAKIPLPARPTHVAFCSGDEALVLATETGTHLAVFVAAGLLQGNSQPALSIPTNGATLRAVVPNPASPGEPTSAFVALVTTNGELLVADLKAGNLVSGPNGPVLKTEVSYVCWSNKGKQLVAGLADGTGYQLSPDGAKKDEIPRPPELEPNCHGECLDGHVCKCLTVQFLPLLGSKMISFSWCTPRILSRMKWVGVRLRLIILLRGENKGRS